MSAYASGCWRTSLSTARSCSEVWLWDEWPGRWGRDAGIDLVAEDHEGGLWAVQAKHYDPAYAIKKADLDSFLSESSRPGFTYRLADRHHRPPRADRTEHARRPGEAGRDAPSLPAGAAGGRLADLARRACVRRSRSGSGLARTSVEAIQDCA